MRPHDKYWNALTDYLKEKNLEDRVFIGPDELLYEFPQVYPYQILKDIRFSDYDIEYVVFHKKSAENMTNDFLDMIRNEYKAVWGNKRFVIFKKHPGKWEKIKAKKYLLHTHIHWKKYYKPASPGKTGILITTHNRPHSLRRLLEQLKNRPEKILVVNDGSDAKFQSEYETIKKDFPQATFIDNPQHRGQEFAMNTGFSWFLADPHTEWVHYFQGDVILNPGFFETVSKVAHKEKYPVVTGLYHETHNICKRGTINEVPVYMLRSAPMHHLFFHRLYLQENLPVPNPLSGVPERDTGKPNLDSSEGWWLVSWSPKSIVKRNGYVVCIPGLCQIKTSAAQSVRATE